MRGNLPPDTMTGLLARLPATRGKLRANAELSNTNWFRVGGRAEVLFRPEDAQDLADFIAAKPADVLVTVLGVGSNLLVRDGGIDGVVIKLGRGFAQINAEADNTIYTGAAAMSLNAALVAQENAVAGLEFLSGIPGTIGGALAMNAGAYGKETSAALVEAELVDAEGTLRRMKTEELHFRYRGNGAPQGAIFTGGWFKGEAGDKEEIARRIQEITQARSDTQPIKSRTGGSTFKNPTGHKAWELIDKAGCRGLMVGGAQVSEKHCNFLINTGSATAADIEALGEEVRRRVFDSSGIMLEWEIKIIGKPVAAEKQLEEVA